jgi:hypothetical protein
MKKTVLAILLFVIAVCSIATAQTYGPGIPTSTCSSASVNSSWIDSGTGSNYTCKSFLGNFVWITNNPFIGTVSGGILGISTNGVLSSVSLEGSIIPNAANTYSLGSVTYPWAGVYANNFYGSLSGGVLGSTFYQSAPNTTAILAPNTTTTLNVLTQTGTGTVGAAPAWLATTGSGSVVRATSPTLVTPNLGAAVVTGLTEGTLGYTAANSLASFSGNVNNYLQFIIRNIMSGTAASADFIVNNNSSTDTTYYGDFGMNSSAFTGTGSLNLANAVYLYAQTGDLVLGTNTANAIHFVTNAGTTDSATVSSAGVWTFANSPVVTANTATLTPGTGVTSVTCASAACTNLRGTLTIVGGTATTGTVAALSWTATPTAYVCTATMNGGATSYGIGNSVATTTGMNVTTAVSVLGITFTVNYSCQP